MVKVDIVGFTNRYEEVFLTLREFIELMVNEAKA